MRKTFTEVVMFGNQPQVIEFCADCAVIASHCVCAYISEQRKEELRQEHAEWLRLKELRKYEEN